MPERRLKVTNDMKDFKIARIQMLGAWRAGKSLKYISQISGASISAVRYWIKQVTDHDLQVATKFNRAYKRKGFRIIRDRYKVHNFISHDSGQNSCERCVFSPIKFNA